MSDNVTPVGSPPPARPRAPRWMWWLLTASLAANLLIVGFAIGAAWRFHGYGPRGGLDARIERFVMTLPSDRRDPILNILKKSRQDIRELRVKIRTARRELAGAVRAETFDINAYRAHQNDLRTASGQLAETIGVTIGDVAQKLNAEERRRFLRVWRRRHPHRRGPRRD